MKAKFRNELKDACFIKTIKQRDALLPLIDRARYVCAHRYGKHDPVGTRLVAINDLRDELHRVESALEKLGVI